jgi:hypothetical protein
VLSDAPFLARAAAELALAVFTSTAISVPEPSRRPKPQFGCRSPESAALERHWSEPRCAGRHRHFALSPEDEAESCNRALSPCFKLFPVAMPLRLEPLVSHPMSSPVQHPHHTIGP